jgi:nitronate monooxygenase
MQPIILDAIGRAHERGHAVYPALALPPGPLAPALDALASETRAFGVNFLVATMDRRSLEPAAERAPYVDFFLSDADPDLVATVHAGGAVCGWQVESADEARAAEAAGGIATARGVAAATAAGADGVRVGTRFIAARESDAHPEWVGAVPAAGPEDAVVSTAFNEGRCGDRGRARGRHRRRAARGPSARPLSAPRLHPPTRRI